MSGVAGSLAPSLDPLDLQDLWSLTTDLVNVTQSVCSTISTLARSLSEDANSSATPLRQQLLEIRARLVYLLGEVAYAVITHTRTLVRSAAIVMSSNLASELSEDALTDLEPQWTRVVEACALNRASIDDCLSAWDAFFPVLHDYRLTRSQSTGPVTTFLRALGVLGVETMDASVSTEAPLLDPSVPTVHSGLQATAECLTQLEAFWRKRQSLFLSPGISLAPDQLIRGHETWSNFAELHASFNYQLYSCIDSLRMPEPIISKYPTSLTENIKLRLGWRALITE